MSQWYTLGKLFHLRDVVHFCNRVGRQEDQEELSTGQVDFVKKLPATSIQFTSAKYEKKSLEIYSSLCEKLKIEN